MYTIKQAARLTGVAVPTLRAWEKRYALVVPRRNESGYRLYDQDAVAVLSTMRRLVEEGWAPATAAAALRAGEVPVAPLDSLTPVVLAAGPPPVEADRGADSGLPHAVTYMEGFLTSAARMDSAGIERSLDGGMSLGSFEHVVDSWLLPTLEALGEGWARGEIDVAGEHAASHAVHRRLSAAFQAAGSTSRGARVVVGLPPGSRHELGALAFAVAARRRGLDVLYLGADVPVSSWGAAVRTHEARAAVLSVVTAEDRTAAIGVVQRLRADAPEASPCSGGAAGTDLGNGVRTLSHSIGAAAEELDDLVHAADR